jgi:hypothetical protein
MTHIPCIAHRVFIFLLEGTAEFGHANKSDYQESDTFIVSIMSLTDKYIWGNQVPKSAAMG